MLNCLNVSRSTPPVRLLFAVVTTLARRLDHSSPDGEMSTFEVNVIPREPERFFASKAGRRVENEQCVQAVVFRTSGKRAICSALRTGCAGHEGLDVGELGQEQRTDSRGSDHL